MYQVSLFELFEITKKDAIKWVLITLVVSCLYFACVFSANTTLANYGFSYNPNYLSSASAFFSNLTHFFKWITSSFSSFSSYLKTEENLNDFLLQISLALVWGNFSALLLLQKKLPIKEILFAFIVSFVLFVLITFVLNIFLTPAMGRVPCDAFAIFYRICYYPNNVIKGFDFNLTNALIFLGILTASFSTLFICLEKNDKINDKVTSFFEKIDFDFENFFKFRKNERRAWIIIALVVACIYLIFALSNNNVLANYGYTYTPNYLSSASAFFNHFAYFFKWITLSFSSFSSFIGENLDLFIRQVCYALLIGNLAALFFRQEDSSYRRILLAAIISFVSLFVLAFVANLCAPPAMGFVPFDPLAIINRLRYYPNGLINGCTITTKGAFITWCSLTIVLSIIFIVYSKVTEARRHFYKDRCADLKRVLKILDTREKEIKKYYVDPSEYAKATVIDSKTIPTVEQMFTMNDDEVTKILNSLNRPLEEKDLSKECVGIYIKKKGE